MHRKLTHLKVFIASPGGLIAERETFKEVLHNYNLNDAVARGIFFEPVGWEDTLSDYKRSQSLINDDLRQCEYFILLLHDRWGTPPRDPESKYSSGTEEEFYVAQECLMDESMPMRRMMFFFKDVPAAQLNDPGEQLIKVLEFKKSLQDVNNALYKTFDTEARFADLLKKHLAGIVRSIETSKNGNKEIDRDLINIKTAFEGSTFKWVTSLISGEDWESLEQTANSFLKEGKVVEAELIFSQIAQKSRNPLLIARYGKYLRGQGRIHNAKDIIDRAKNLAELIDDKSAKAYAIRQLGRIEEHKGKMIDALKLLKDAYEIYEEINDQLSVAKTLRDIGFVENRLGNSESAIEFLNKSIEIYKQHKDFSEQATSMTYLGVIYKDLAEYEKGLEYQMQALDIQRSIHNNESAVIRALSGIGVIYRMMGEIDEALKYHEEALRKFETLGDIRGRAKELSNIGVTLKRKEKFEEAIEYHQKALELDTFSGNDRGMQIQFSCIGLNMIEMNKFSDAEYYFNKALELSRRNDDRKGESLQYKHFGTLYLKKGDVNIALKYTLKGLKIDKQINNEFGIADCNEKLGMLYIEIDEVHQAKLLLLDALSYFKSKHIKHRVKIIEDVLKSLDN